eukprot:9457714-Pyramimonas_sp.AAC.1
MASISCRSRRISSSRGFGEEVGEAEAAAGRPERDDESGSTDSGRPPARNRQTLVSVVCGRRSPASAGLRSTDQYPAMDHLGQESRRH